MTNKILALDLGKSKTAARLRCADGRADYAATIGTTPQDLHDLVAATDPDLVIIEASAQAYWVHDLIAAMEKKVLVTANNGPGWRWTNVRNKSDRGDAAKLLKMHASDQLEPVHVPDHAVRQWRSLIRHRHALVGDRTAVRNRVAAVLTGQGLPEPQAKTGWTKAWTRELLQHAKPLDQCGPEELWRGRLWQDLAMHKAIQELIDQVEKTLEDLSARRDAVAFIQQEVGVGPRLAETLVATIDDPLRFAKGKQVACYIGLTPRHWQSGEMLRQGGISKQGNSLLRTLLVEVSWLGLGRNAWMRETYERVKRGVAGRSKIAIVAVARQLLVRLWAKWRDWERRRRAQAAGETAAGPLDALPSPC